MPFNVYYADLAQEELTFFKLEAADPDAVILAAQKLEKLLTSTPEVGQKKNGFFLLRCDPLSVTYTISSHELRVTVLQFFYHG